MSIRLILVYHITIGKEVIIHLLFSLIITFQLVIHTIYHAGVRYLP